MNTIDEIVNECFLNLKVSSDFSDQATVDSIKSLLDCIIDNPVMVTRSQNEEKFSVVMSSIMTSNFANNETYKGINVRNMVFACSFYLFMHQLDKGTFYDRDWSGFVTLLHYSRNEFAKFIVETNPFAPERINKITGRPIDTQRSINVAKGFELNMMLIADRKGYLYDELTDWYDELKEDADELLESDPFRKEALPLYQVITNYLQENDITFVNNI